MSTLSYRQELDILENLESALQYNTANIDDISWQVAAEWPSDHTGERITQWLQARQPDLDDTTLTEGYGNVTELITPQHLNNLTQSLHDIIGTILHGLASDYINTVINIDTTPEETLTTIKGEIAEHREHLQLTNGHALTAPYRYHLYTGHNNIHAVHVTENN
jgi:hypothetical protein